MRINLLLSRFHFCEQKCLCGNCTSYYLVTSPLAFGYADVGCFRDDDTLRRVVTLTSGFEDLILKMWKNISVEFQS